MTIPKDNEIIVKWAKEPTESEEDICFFNGSQIDVSDVSMVHSMLTKEHHHPYDDSWSPSFIEELKSRGYDISTLKFCISKKVNIIAIGKN
jgi:hypothetical protein